MLLGRIKLDRKAERVVIKAERFYLNAATGYFWTECGLIDLLLDVRFSEIPRNLVIHSRFTPDVLLQDEPRFKVKIGRSGVLASMSISESGWSQLVELSEYVEKLVIVLRSNKFDVEHRIGTDKDRRSTNSITARLDTNEDAEIGELLGSLDECAKQVNVWGGARNDQLSKDVHRWCERIKSLDGKAVSRALKLRGSVRWIMSDLNSEDIGYLLFQISPVMMNKRFCEKVLLCLNIDRKEVSTRLKYLGMVNHDEWMIIHGPTRVGELVKSMLWQAVTSASLKIGESDQKANEVRPLECLYYINRSIRSMAASQSKKLRANRKKLKAYEQAVKENITFVYIAILGSLHMHLPVPKDLLSVELQQLVRLGVISEKLRIRPYGGWLLRLVRSYLRRKGVAKSFPTKQEWEALWTWRTN